MAADYFDIRACQRGLTADQAAEFRQQWSGGAAASRGGSPFKRPVWQKRVTGADIFTVSKEELSEIEQALKDYNARVRKNFTKEQRKNYGALKPLRYTTAAVWVPVGQAKVLMDWKVIEPLNKLLLGLEVELVTDVSLATLKVRFYGWQKLGFGVMRSVFKGEYTLRSLIGIRYKKYEDFAPTCIVAASVGGYCG